MRCREAERRLNLLEVEHADIDEPLREHLACCEACARRYEAAIALRRALATERAALPAPVRSLEDLRRAVESAHLPHRTHTGKVLPIMAKIWNPLSGRVRWGIGICTAVAAVALVTLIPLRYEQTVGYEVAFAGVDPALAMDQTRIHTMLSKLGVQRADIDLGECEETCKLKISELKTPEDCQLIVCAFEEMGNVMVLNDGSSNQVYEVRQAGEPVEFVAKDGNVSCYFSQDEAHKIVVDRLGEDFATEYNIFVSKDCAEGLAGIQNVRIDMVASGAGDGDGSACRILCETPDGVHCESLVKCLGDSAVCTAGSCVVCNAKSGCRPDGGLVELLATEGLTMDDLRNARDEETLARLAKLGIIVDLTGDGHFVFKDGADNCRFGEPDANSWTEDEAQTAAKEGVTPEGYELGENYPNPFNPSTSIDYTLPSSQRVRIDVINVMGRTVTTLVDDVRGPGPHTVVWDGTDRFGLQVASGTYFYRIETPGFRETRSMSLLK